MVSVIGKVNARLVDELKNEYPDLNITSVSSKAPDVFPTLSIVSIGEETAASDLQAEQAGIWSTVELKAYTDTYFSEASDLLDTAGDVMLSMGYQLTFIQPLSDVKPFCKVARFRRIVGSGDFLYKD